MASSQLELSGCSLRWGHLSSLPQSPPLPNCSLTVSTHHLQQACFKNLRLMVWLLGALSFTILRRWWSIPSLCRLRNWGNKQHRSWQREEAPTMADTGLSQRGRGLHTAEKVYSRVRPAPPLPTPQPGGTLKMTSALDIVRKPHHEAFTSQSL